VLISVASIADRLRYEVDQLPNVLRTRPDVSGKRGGVVVELDVEAAAGINVPDQAAQIVAVAQRVVEDDMGLKLARPPKVNMRVMTHPKVSKRDVPVASPPKIFVPAPPAEPPAGEVESVLWPEAEDVTSDADAVE
jgi:hypothetical protein